jgi:hypothetical protein
LVDTATIPAALGTAFGVGFRVTVPNIDTVRTTVTWRFPAAGLSNPRTGETTYVYSREVECTPVVHRRPVTLLTLRATGLVFLHLAPPADRRRPVRPAPADARV